DLATGAADVDAAAERGAGAVADVEVGHLEVQVPAAAPGSHREGGREVAVLGDERLHGLHAAGVGVDVDHEDARRRAGEDGDVGRVAAAPVRRDLVGAHTLSGLPVAPDGQLAAARVVGTVGRHDDPS